MGRQSERISTADHNQAVRVYTLSEWARLLKMATDHNFTGSVAIEISAKDGRLGEPRITASKYGIQQS